MTETKLIAGRANLGKRVHYFTESGWAICNQGAHLDQIAPDSWDPAHPDTCRKCRERLKWFRMGFKPVWSSDTVASPPAPSPT